ncbi:uncharacterized protein [Henckelia pumila]|uniref:uncharacterized protein n=1 Tax=Henckelia pumila TaxID=405737 RepID=UPI003C6DF6AB
MFFKKDYDDLKIFMQAHLSAQDDGMWYVVIDGPMKITKINIAVAIWTTEDKKKAKLDNVSKDILYKTLDKNMFSKIKNCNTAKEILVKLIQLCEGNDQTKENKITVAIQNFDNVKMKPGETMTEFDERFNNIVCELISLDKS